VAGGLRLRLGGGIVALGNLSGLTAFLFAFRGWFNGPHLDHNVASAKRVSNPNGQVRIPTQLFDIGVLDNFRSESVTDLENVWQGVGWLRVDNNEILIGPLSNALPKRLIGKH